MTDAASITQLPLWIFSLQPTETLEKQPDLHTLSLCQDHLPFCAATSPTIMRCLELLGPLEWAYFPERNLTKTQFSYK